MIVLELVHGDECFRFEEATILSDPSSFSLDSCASIKDELHDALWDYCIRMFDALEISPQGQIDDYCDVYCELEERVKKQIISDSGQKGRIAAYNNSEELIKELSIDVNSCLLAIVNEISSGENADIIAARAIESSIQEFVRLGKWNRGLRSVNGEIITDIEKWPEPASTEAPWTLELNGFEPIIWFGPSNSAPLDSWSITPKLYHNSDGEQAKLEIWFEVDSYTKWVETVSNSEDGAFLTWAIYECGFEIPDRDDVVRTCPIPLAENMEAEELKKKVNQYFLSLKAKP